MVASIRNKVIWSRLFEREGNFRTGNSLLCICGIAIAGPTVPAPWMILGKAFFMHCIGFGWRINPGYGRYTYYYASC